MIYLINADCAPTALNNGMKTVDMAWDIFLKKNNLPLSYKRFSAKTHESSVQVTNKVKLDYKGSSEFKIEDLNYDDLLIYWGDFLHANHYLKNDLCRLTRKPKIFTKRYLKKLFNKKNNKTLDKCNYMSFVQGFYLPNCENKTWKKTISFGTTLIGDNDFENFASSDYQKSFSYFIRSLDRVWTRDVISALQISHMRNDYQTNFLGVDAALLIDEKDYEAILDQPTFEIPKVEYIVTHFSRSEVSINKLMNFSVAIKNEMEMPLYWIPWLTSLKHKKFNDLDNSLKKSVFDFNKTKYSDLIHLLKNAKIIITDTYHLALIGWRLGKPVLCVGSGSQYPEFTIHDKKKEIFYTMHNMLPLYFFAELLDDEEKVKEYIGFVKKVLNDGNVIKNLVSKIKYQAESVEEDLANYLRLSLNAGEKK